MARKRGSLSRSHRALAGSELRPAYSARRVANADPAEKIQLTVRLRRKAGHAELPDQLHWSRTAPGKRIFLQREEFAEQYGAEPKDVTALRKFAKLNGLKVVEASLARRTLILSGTTQQMNRIFGTDLGIYAVADGVYRGYEGRLAVPKSIANIVEGVFGLDTRKVLRRQSSPAPAGSAPLTPPQVARLYGFDAARSRGAGQTIGIIEFGGGYVRRRSSPGIEILPDIDAFFNGLGIPRPQITDVSVDGATNDASALAPQASFEVALDIDVAGSVAPDAHIVVYFAPNTAQGMIDAISTAVHDAENCPSVISISWAGAEFDPNDKPVWNQSTYESVSASFAEAAAMGVSVIAASGDDGSNCFVNDGKAHVNYPASDPWVTGCGGTIITDVGGSEFQEHTWNDFSWSGSVYVGYLGGATGGGYSRVFPRPKWQGPAKGALPRLGSSGRGVPDIAGNASPYSGYTIESFGVSSVIGGTSATAPLYAGFFARLNGMLGFNLGYLNPTLYQSNAPLSIFRDIKDGVSNAAPCGLPGGLYSIGYKSVPGWDPCTGLGVIDGGLLVDRFIPVEGVVTQK